MDTSVQAQAYALIFSAAFVRIFPPTLQGRRGPTADSFYFRLFRELTHAFPCPGHREKNVCVFVYINMHILTHTYTGISI